jgi:hypothetical protein
MEQASMVLRARLVKNLEGANQRDQCDVVQHNGDYWLVPQWIESDRPRSKRPARMVSPKTIPHEKMRGEHQFRISDPLPKWLFDGSPRPRGEQRSLVVLEYPEIEFPAQPGARNGSES